MLAEQVIIGIDGGGTNTRVIVCEPSGKVLSYVERGGASIYRNPTAKQNVQQAIEEALEQANRQSHQVIGITAGIAGYDLPSDLDWIRPLTDVPGITCPQWHINDAVIAHFGALMSEPGIVVIAGTGSIIFAITETGQHLTNYDFHHYAASAARLISYDAVYEVLSGNRDHTDEWLIQDMLQHWNATSLDDFYILARQGFVEDKQERDRLFGKFAPFVTEAAERGSNVAIEVCNKATDQIKVGVELLASSFSEHIVNVALIGSVANSGHFVTILNDKLGAGHNKQYQMVKPRFSPVIGAILYSMNKLNIRITEEVLGHLDHFKSTKESSK